jgi:phage replication O-like protein O
VKTYPSKQERLSPEQLRRFIAGGYTMMPNWIFDVMADKRLPASYLRFLLCLIRQTIGWSKDEDKLSVDDFVEMTGAMRRSDVARYSHAMHVAKLIKFQPGERGRKKSTYTLLDNFGDPTIVRSFLSSLADALADEKSDIECGKSPWMAERMAASVHAKMETFNAALEGMRAALGAETADNYGLSPESLLIAQKLAATNVGKAQTDAF